MSKRIKMNPLPYQAQALRSNKPKVYLSAGYGGGKTYWLCMHGFKLMNRNFGLPGGLIVPNMKMFYRDVEPTIDDICKTNGITYKYDYKRNLYKFPNTQSKLYVFHDEDKGKSIKGPNLAFMLYNEVTLISESGFKAGLGRIRLKKASLPQAAMSGTPEGFNWTYDYFIANPREDTDLIVGDARQNTYISAEYYQMLSESYDDLMFRMYVLGEHLDLTGYRALHKFNRMKHTAHDVMPDLDGRPMVTVDFNVSPFCATLWTINDYTRELRGYDEVYIPNNADTELFCQTLKEKLRDNGIEHNYFDIDIYPDPAGNARSTKGVDRTDVSIIKSAGFESVKFRSKIKSVRDALNATNRFLDQYKVVLDQNKCKHTIVDFERTKLKEGTFELDKSDPLRTHFVDGFKNFVYYEFPMNVRPSEWRSHQIR